MSNKFLDLGVIKHVKGKNADTGEEYSFLAIDLKQSVDIYVKGEKVSFSTYEAGGKTYENKSVSISPVEESISRLEKALNEEKISEEMYNDITSGFEKKNVKYTLGISSKAQS